MPPETTGGRVSMARLLSGPSEQLLSAEASSEGHPDKICDLISDTIVDLYLRADPYSRASIQTMATTDLVVIAGEICASIPSDIPELESVAREVVRRVGYDQERFSWRTFQFQDHLHKIDDSASGELAVDTRNETGDVATVYGYACRETPDLMPAPIYYAQLILRRIAELRHANDKLVTCLRPDAKAQITLRYVDGIPVGATSIVVATQHEAHLESDQIKSILWPIVANTLPDGWMCPEQEFYVNPFGSFVIGGPVGDCGMNGRQVAQDTYGGVVPNGGGALSGKGPFGISRAGAYMARYLAKNIVAAELAEKCTVQLAYALGIAAPLSVYVDAQGSSLAEEEKIQRCLRDLVNLSPRGIREHLHLNRPIYARTAAYGHFGRDPDDDGGFPWERIELVPLLRSMEWARMPKAQRSHSSGSGDGDATIVRECDVPPSYTGAVLSLLGFFKEIVDNALPEANPSVSVQQSGQTVRIVIEVPTTHLEQTEELLEKYSDVLRGEQAPDEAFQDEVLILKLQNKIDEAQLIIRNEQRLRELESAMHDRELKFQATVYREMLDRERESASNIDRRAHRLEDDVRIAWEQTRTLISHALLHDRSGNVHIGRVASLGAIGGAVSGDSYRVHAKQIGSMNRDGGTQHSIAQKLYDGLDPLKLAEELAELRGPITQEPAPPGKRRRLLDTLTNAESAAIEGDLPRTFGFLRRGGKWLLSTAEKVGVPLAVEAIKRAMLS